MTVTVPESPVLVTLRDVELMRVGEWDISTGMFYATPDILAQAVAALECPAVRNPIIKFGHTDPRASGDGEPAAGYITNIALADNGSTLTSDWCGMPKWFADVLPSAYPDRSVEGEYDHVCQLGHTHPFVLTGVALMGTARPGIGTLESLNLRTVAEAYGVAAAERGSGVPVVLPMKAGSAMAAATISAQATTTDLMQQFYDQPAVEQNWWIWIEEVFIDPAQVIAEDGSDSTLWSYDYTVDAEGVFTFSDPKQVLRTYVAASARKPAVAFASMQESRPAAHAALAARKAFASAETTGTEPENNPESTPDNEEGKSTMALTDELRTRLGITDENADETTILGALDEALNTAAADTDVAAGAGQPAPEPPGTIRVDAATFEQLRADAESGRLARAEQISARRSSLVDAAVRAGKIAPASREGWSSYLSAGNADMQAAAEKQLNELPAGTIPTSLIGHGQNEPGTVTASAPVSGWVVPTGVRAGNQAND